MNKIITATRILILLVSTLLRTHAHGDLHAQIERASQAIHRQPRDSHLYLKRANLYLQHEEWTNALADLRVARKINPSSEIAFLEGIVLLQSGSPVDARAKFDEVLATEPAHGEAILNRARTFVRTGDYPQAAREYARSLAVLKAPDPDILVEIARACMKADLTREGLRILEDGMNKLGKIPALQLCAIELERQLGNFIDALKRLGEVRKSGGLQIRWNALEGEILLQAQKMAAAKQSFEAALKELSSLSPAQQARWADLKSSLEEQLAKIRKGPDQP